MKKVSKTVGTKNEKKKEGKPTKKSLYEFPPPSDHCRPTPTKSYMIFHQVDNSFYTSDDIKRVCKFSFMLEYSRLFARYEHYIQIYCCFAPGGEGVWKNDDVLTLPILCTLLTGCPSLGWQADTDI